MPNSVNNLTLFSSKEYRWADMSFTFLGVQIKGITELTYQVEVENEELFAAGDEPVDIQSGNRKYSGSMVLLKNTYDALDIAAKAAGYRDVLDINLAISVSYTNTTRITTDILVNVHLDKYNGGGKQNDKFIPITLPFKFTRIRSNV